MKRVFPMTIFLFLALAAGLRTFGQDSINDTVTTQVGPVDTLTADVVQWNRARAQPAAFGEIRDLLTDATHDLSLLDINAYIVYPGKSVAPPAREAVDRLLIVRDGNITVSIGTQRKALGPGGVGLFSAVDAPVFLNTGTANATFYLFSFRGKGHIDRGRAKQAGGPLLLDWPELTMKKTDKGESRPIFSRPVAWLQKIDMHATTLDAGQISHPQHVHRAEEIILMRSGHVRMHIADSWQKATDGDLVFLSSGVPHNLENGEDGRCEYFALQWER